MSHFRTRRLGSFEKRLTRPLILILVVSHKGIARGPLCHASLLREWYGDVGVYFFQWGNEISSI